MNPIIDMGNFYNQLLQAMAGAERVFNLLDTPADVADAPTRNRSRGSPATSASRTSSSATTPTAPSCTASTSRPGPAR